LTPITCPEAIRDASVGADDDLQPEVAQNRGLSAVENFE
jgi:hypothetical protein